MYISQWICARLRNSTRYRAGEEFPHSIGILLTLGREVLPYVFVHHEVQAHLKKKEQSAFVLPSFLDCGFRSCIHMVLRLQLWG